MRKPAETVNQADSLPYFKFYAGDWIAGSIQGYDMQAQGVFINLMALAWRRGGWLKIDQRLARQLGLQFDELTAAINELSIAKGPLIAKAGNVSSKFLLAQLKERAEQHSKRVEAGRKGGKAKQLNRSSKAKAKIEQCSTILESESESESDKRSAQKKPKRKDAEKIYEAYPRKIGKAGAVTSILKALTKIDFEGLMESVQAYAAAVGDLDSENRKYVPHPATWFNQERWHDDRREWGVNKDGDADLKPGDVTSDGYKVRGAL